MRRRLEKVSTDYKEIMSDILTVSHLHKNFGHLKAVDDLSFEVKEILEPFAVLFNRGHMNVLVFGHVNHTACLQ